MDYSRVQPNKQAWPQNFTKASTFSNQKRILGNETSIPESLNQMGTKNFNHNVVLTQQQQNRLPTHDYSDQATQTFGQLQTVAVNQTFGHVQNLYINQPLQQSQSMSHFGQSINSNINQANNQPVGQCLTIPPVQSVRPIVYQPHNILVQTSQYNHPAVMQSSGQNLNTVMVQAPGQTSNKVNLQPFEVQLSGQSLDTGRVQLSGQPINEIMKRPTNNKMLNQNQAKPYDQSGSLNINLPVREFFSHNPNRPIAQNMHAQPQNFNTVIRPTGAHNQCLDQNVGFNGNHSQRISLSQKTVLNQQQRGNSNVVRDTNRVKFAPNHSHVVNNTFTNSKNKELVSSSSKISLNVIPNIEKDTSSSNFQLCQEPLNTGFEKNLSLQSNIISNPILNSLLDTSNSKDLNAGNSYNEKYKNQFTETLIKRQQKCESYKYEQKNTPQSSIFAQNFRIPVQVEEKSSNLVIDLTDSHTNLESSPRNKGIRSCKAVYNESKDHAVNENSLKNTSNDTSWPTGITIQVSCNDFLREALSKPSGLKDNINVKDISKAVPPMQFMIKSNNSNFAVNENQRKEKDDIGLAENSGNEPLKKKKDDIATNSSGIEELAIINKEQVNVTCHVCTEIVDKLKDLKNHLIFGHLQCLNCSQRIVSCEVWCNNSLDADVRKKCEASELGKHVFEKWNQNPADYLLYFINRDLTIMNFCLHNKNTVVKRNELTNEMNKYLKSISYLKTYIPWRYALMACKDYLNGRIKEETKSLNKEQEICKTIDESLNKEQEICKPVDKILNKEQEISKAIDNSPVKTEMSDEKHLVFGRKTFYSRKCVTDIKPKVKLRNYDPFAIPDDKRYMEIRLGHNASYPEECPQCYYPICPSRFIIHAVTFKIVYFCVECDLPIFFVQSTHFSITEDTAFQFKEVPVTERQLIVKKVGKRNRVSKDLQCKDTQIPLIKMSKTQEEEDELLRRKFNCKELKINLIRCNKKRKLL